jgi:schlafen family protein
MSFFGKPLNELVQGDLETLVQEEVRERQTLEFKRDSYARNDEGTREMLRDISAVANAYGGDILLGIETVGDGVAARLVGVPDGEQAAQRITSSCLSNIEERIGGMAVWPVPISDGNHVIVVRVPQSLRAPHMVTFKGLNQFWVRHDRQKSRMSVHEIRETCLRVEMLTTRVTEFLEKRLAGVSGFARSTLTVSVTPLLIAREIVDTKNQRLREIIRDWALNDGYMPAPCITGLEVRRAKGIWLRLDRNGHLDLWVDLTGYIEGFDTSDSPFRLLAASAVKNYVAGLCALGKGVYEHCGIREPLIAKLDIWDIRGVSVRGKSSRLGFHGEPRTWLSEHLNLDPMEIDSLHDPENVARIVLQRLAEAFGFDESPFL